MLNALVVVATLEAKAGQLELVKAEAQQLIDLTRIEPGCVEYVLHQDNENPLVLVFIERWESKAALESHIASEHFQAFSAATKQAVASLNINQLTMIG